MAARLRQRHERGDEGGEGDDAARDLHQRSGAEIAGDYCEANPASNLANAANEWYATLPKQTDPTAAVKDPSDNSLTLSLDRAPKNKPLLDRH